MQREKGARGEREAAAKLASLFSGASAHRGRQYHGGPESPDVWSNLPLHCEVKRTESISVYKAMTQAVADCAADKIPVVLHRRNNHAWLAILRLDDLPTLISSLSTWVAAFPIPGDRAMASAGNTPGEADRSNPTPCSLERTGTTASPTAGSIFTGAAVGEVISTV
jgi:hypothetical protein